MPVHAISLALALSLFVSLVFSCSSDLDCSLNGACAAGACACRPGWIGPDCGALDFLPAPLTQAFYRPTTASWGGSIIEDGGQWHMYLAVIEGNCGLNAWQPNSAIYHAVSASGSPAGPFVNESKILDWFSHNPAVSRAPDGTLLVWHIGCGSGGGGFNGNCTNGTTPPPPPPPPPPPVKFVNGGRCLVPSGAFPCWSGGQYEACPLVLGACDGPEAGWLVEGNTLLNAAYPSAALNMDCNACATGTIAKLFNDGGSGIAFNASTGQLQDLHCPGVCLSTGAGGGANAPCGGNGEPYVATQIAAAPCSSPDTLGWSMPAAADAREGGSAPRLLETARVSSGGAAYPAPCTEINALVSTTGARGPWVQTGLIQGNSFPPLFETDNPAALHFANGSTWVMFRSWHPPGNTTTPIGIARSDGATWNGSYTILNATIPQFASVNATEPSYIPLEDPTMWIDEASQTFHALFHNMGGCATVGCHAFSEDGYTWYLAATGPYTSNITYVNGTTINVARRERPHLVFNSLGQPAFLSNGVQVAWEADHSFTHVHPINVAWP